MMDKAFFKLIVDRHQSDQTVRYRTANKEWAYLLAVTNSRKAEAANKLERLNKIA